MRLAHSTKDRSKPVPYCQHNRNKDNAKDRKRMDKTQRASINQVLLNSPQEPKPSAILEPPCKVSDPQRDFMDSTKRLFGMAVSRECDPCSENQHPKDNSEPWCHHTQFNNKKRSICSAARFSDKLLALVLRPGGVRAADCTDMDLCKDGRISPQKKCFLPVHRGGLLHLVPWVVRLQRHRSKHAFIVWLKNPCHQQTKASN